MNKGQKAKLTAAIGQIQDLIRQAYPDSEDAQLEIKGDDVTVIGMDGDIMETACTAERAINRLIEDGE